MLLTKHVSEKDRGEVKRIEYDIKDEELFVSTGCLVELDRARQRVHDSPRLDVTATRVSPRQPASCFRNGQKERPVNNNIARGENVSPDPRVAAVLGRVRERAAVSEGGW